MLLKCFRNNTNRWLTEVQPPLDREKAVLNRILKDAWTGSEEHPTDLQQLGEARHKGMAGSKLCALGFE